jgi:hypothetical protein
MRLHCMWFTHKAQVQVRSPRLPRLEVVDREKRRLVTRIFTSWNHNAGWLKGLDALRIVA